MLESHRLELILLSSESYGRMADLALGYHLSQSEAEILREAEILQECLPPVVVVYFYTDMVRRSSFNQIYFMLNLTVPHVVIGTGWGNVWQNPQQLQVIDNPYLLRWYGSSQERSQETYMESGNHPKAYPLPVGLVSPINRFQQVPYIVQVNQAISEYRQASFSAPDLGRTHLILINFSAESEKARFRAEPWNLFCNTTHNDYIAMNQTCRNGGFYDRNVPGRRRRIFQHEWAEMAVDVYKEWALHKYTVNPRGQQKDCHRFWEALYVGSVPIVLKKEGYYQDVVQHYFQLPIEEVPVLFVQRWRHVTPALLNGLWEERFVPLLRKPEWQWPQRRLTTHHLRDLLWRGIVEELNQRNDSFVTQEMRRRIPLDDTMFQNRRRCYSRRG
jgi:hypothetical protein